MENPFVGKIRFDELSNGFHVSCEPFVMQRLKALFPKVNRRQVGTVWISNTPENCKDLLWFSDRYDFVGNAFSLLSEGSRRFDEKKDKVMQMLVGNYVPTLPTTLARPLRHYQSAAVALFEVMEVMLLGDDVGLGKSASAIGCFGLDRLPALVVCQTHLPTQWREEIRKFAPHLSIEIVKTGKPYDISRFDVIIMSYSKLAKWIDYLCASELKLVVYDEVQELRRNGTDKYSASQNLNGRVGRILGLSATPVYNWGDEIFNILDSMRSGVLGTREEFLREWCVPFGADKYKVKDPVAFGTYLRHEGLLLRRTRQEVGAELPPVQRIVESIQCDPGRLDEIEDEALFLAKRILHGSFEESGQAARQLDIKLRQMTGLAKAPYVADFVEMLLESSEEKVVLCGWHREVYDVWMSRLAKYSPVLYTGSESPEQKDANKDEFIAGHSRVLILSLRSGVGLNGLQAVCRTLVIGELDWSPAVIDQNIGRLNRDGQADSVSCFFLVSDDGSDPVMSDILGLKRSQSDGIINLGVDVSPVHIETDGSRMKRVAEAYLKAKAGKTKSLR